MEVESKDYFLYILSFKINNYLFEIINKIYMLYIYI